MPRRASWSASLPPGVGSSSPSDGIGIPGSSRDDTPMAHDPDAPPIYELEDVWKSFDGRPVLKGIDLKIPTGQTLVVMGPSGCGKSVMEMSHRSADFGPSDF